MAGWIGLVVVLPLAAVAYQAAGGVGFWSAISDPETVASLKLTILISLGVTAVDVVAGIAVAWVLVRDRFAGKGVVDALIDLPFALPTIVSGLVLLALYGPGSPLGLDVAYTRLAVLFALAFITLPFVVRAVQPVLEALDRDEEEAAACLGASPLAIARRIVLPALVPALVAGGGQAFARAVGEFGSVTLFAGTVPFRTEVGSVRIFNLIESDDPRSAAALAIVLVLVALAVRVALAGARRSLFRDAS